MTSYLDIMGSFLIGGLLLLTVFNLNADLMDRSYGGSLDLIAQEHAASIAELIEYDFRKIGFGVDDSTAAIISADSSRITFWSDIDADSAIDSVRYFLGDVSEASSTPNPLDRVLYRLVNGEPERDVNLGVTNFALTYFDANRNATTTPSEIRTIQVDLTVESTAPYDTRYSRASLRLRIRPKNL